MSLRFAGSLSVASLLLIAATLTGCSTQGSRPTVAAEPVTRLESSAEFVDVDHRVIAPPEPRRAAILVFPFIPGALYGSPQSKGAFMATTDADLRFSLEIAAQSSQVDLAAATSKVAGVVVEPESTRFVRMGTFPFDAQSGEAIGGGGLVDPITREAVLLVYVDRPCTMRGTAKFGDATLEHDLRFSKVGFHWVRLVQLTTPKHHVARNMAASDPVRFIIVP
jgi:hypothetical protein